MAPMRVHRVHGRQALLNGCIILPILALAMPAQAQTTAPAAAQPAASAPAEPSVVTLLLQQARYWRGRSENDKAQVAISRAQQVAPNDPDVLAAQADLQAASGDLDGARRTQATLARIAPGSKQLGDLSRSLQVRSIDPATLSGIRALGAAGKNDAAAAGYRRVFGGTAPPAEFGTEYYQTLAGTSAGWAEAKAGLARIVAANPNDLQAQLAYGQLLTYREPTRAQGIARLQGLAALSDRSPQVASDAARNWHQALLWLPNDKASVPAYQAWLQTHPDDAAIGQRIKEANLQVPTDVGGTDRGSGFKSLAGNQLDDAGKQFEAALALSPKDADALGGLGLVRAKQNRIDEAHQLLARAIAADPDHAARWQPALTGLAVGEDYAAANSLIAHGRFDEAETKLNALIAGGGDVSGAQSMLAGLQQRRGRSSDAAATYNQILSAHPDNDDALLGLARIQMHGGHQAEARALLARLGGRHARDVAQIENQQANGRVARANDPGDRVDLLRDAVAQTPRDGWMRLRLAQNLLKAGQAQEAQQVMAEMNAMSRPTPSMLQAGILFAGQTNDLQTASRLLAQLPKRSRTPDVNAVAGRVALEGDIAEAQADDSFGHSRLIELAQRPDPTGVRGVQIAQALQRLGDTNGARRALQIAERSGGPPTASQRLAYAGELVTLGDTSGAHRLLLALDNQSAGGRGLTRDQEITRKQLGAGMAVVESDQLNEQGKQADAYDRLAPVLAQSPDAVAPRLALARLYQSDSKPRKALALDLAVLQRDPSDLDARLAAVQAAVDCNDLAQAGTLARDALVIGPQDPRAWLAAAAVHRARGAGQAALADLRQASSLRRQQLGTDSNAMINYVIETDTPTSDNPFRTDPVQQGITASDPSPDDIDGLGTGSGQSARRAPADRMLSSIDSQLASLNDTLSPKLDVDIGLRSRSGSGGLDSLTQATVPITATLPFGGGASHWSATLTPTVLSSGSLDQAATTQDRFGTLALGGSSDSNSQSNAAGVAFQVGFANPWLSADAGTSPLGFRTTNAVGGVEFSPKLTPNLTLRVTGERRAITDSVLSYGGLRDPGTNTVWGGVVRNHGHAQFELANKDAVIYAGGGFASITGTHVASNTEVEAGVGGSVSVWHKGDDQVRVGIDLTYFGYDKNLRYFTLGQGGYFSPQSYVAAVVPVTYSGKSGAWTYTGTGSVGYQNYTEHSSNYYPDDPGLQARLVDSDPIASVYSGRSVSGLAGGASGKVEYQLMPALRLGATASYQRAGDWNEAQALLTARYTFSEKP
ncbi:tetratricopeptide repeat protein [Lichenicola cladoniae]|uniref:Tetratricopeptide repeat protein n=1 Tax=Lichenicola cladoniae TaxID=1484109 RepID=A0A6M8HNH3_9PROT|nr:cellulose biosynthesis protein BcsC [Lichenicola cladoniae]NPD67345.1 tetratricopeptide repeat protein [Acetobacteraceae bacterium]QKE89845.1 tetratricopeptide repeat protein [Lichenicola cladoniae]